MSVKSDLSAGTDKRISMTNALSRPCRISFSSKQKAKGRSEGIMNV